MLYDEKDSVINMQTILLLVQNTTQIETKKIIELLFIFEGIGLITRVSKSKLIYTGLKGISIRVAEYINSKSKKQPLQRECHLFSDEITFESKRFNIKVYVTQSFLY